MQPRRVCLRLVSGRLLPATAVGQAQPGTSWVPVPDTLEGRLMGTWDNGRPEGTHPAVWYGWPRGQHDVRDVWFVSDGNETRRVRAYDVEHAIKVSGFERAVVQSIRMKERWY